MCLGSDQGGLSSGLLNDTSAVKIKVSLSHLDCDMQCAGMVRWLLTCPVLFSASVLQRHDG
jgi:hypothetical protein